MYPKNMKSPENKERRILIVDDDVDNLRVVSAVLRWQGYQVQTADSGLKAIEIITDWSPQLVLLDINMPDLSGLETLEKLRRQKYYCSVIFLSGKSRTEDVVNGLDAGADDYICKPFAPEELLGRVRTQLRIKDLNDQLREANEKLKELVDIDDLTGLFNMRSLYQRLEHEMARARRFERCVCVVMMDMDFFKKVNDAHDHLFGSFVLSEIGYIIKSNIRSVDFAARYGGDEFLVVLTEVHREGAELFCERLRATIQNYKFDNGEDEMFLTASLGFAISDPHDDHVDAKNLVRMADRALYEAKGAGRNCVRFYTNPEGAEARGAIPLKRRVGRRHE